MKKIFKTTFSVSEISNLTTWKEIAPAPASGKGHRIVSITNDVQSGTPWSNVNIFASIDSPNAEFIDSDILNTGTRTVHKMQTYGKGGDNIVTTNAITMGSFANPTGGTKPMDVFVCVEEIDISIN